MSEISSLFNGNCIELKTIPGTSLVELSVNLKNESVNKFNAETLAELKTAISILQKAPPSGLLISSGKDAFLAGADITEFLEHFKRPEIELQNWISETQSLFSSIEDLPCPTVCTLSGFALGGGLEFALTCDYRIAAPGTKIGLPETQLGIIPGWGGTVRLPRLIGVDPAVEWIASGKQNTAEKALQVGLINAIVESAEHHAAAVKLLEDCVSGKLNWKKQRSKKILPPPLTGSEREMSMMLGRAGILAVAGKNYPAPMAAFEAIEKSMDANREEALLNEAKAFSKVSKTDVAQAMVGNFLADQGVKKKAKGSKSQAQAIQRAAVLGAGIMGGGIAYQSATSGVSIVMKDIQEDALQKGMAETTKLLDKQIQKGRATPITMAQTLGRIHATLKQDDLADCDFVIEAVTENEKIKTSVLQQTESTLKPHSIIASNTSTISITHLAESLKRPEKFCGMHFFNPVPVMPLVEIIRGKKTAPETIATAVQYALQMRKTPIVVNDCPGFLVNRILFAYFTAFNQLIEEKVNFARIDRVMEKWGWPMGPAYLLDVVGVDTGAHASEVMAKGFPDRMPFKENYAVNALYKAERFGQKNKKGFYEYAFDKKGRLQKSLSTEVYSILGMSESDDSSTVSDQDIIDRLMLPFVFESARCLDENIVDTAMELDLAMLTGLGFPPFRGGPLQYAKSVGAQALIDRGSKLHATYGPLYEPTQGIQTVLKNNI